MQETLTSSQIYFPVLVQIGHRNRSGCRIDRRVHRAWKKGPQPAEGHAL